MAISPSSAVAHALDRDSLIAWFEKNRARSAQLFAMLDPDDVLHAADRAAQSDRVLRRASARLQRHRADQARPRARRASTKRSSACSRAASIRRTSSRRSRASNPSRVADARRDRAGLRARAPTIWCVEALRRRDDRSCPVMPCSIAPRARTRCSSTRRCIRRRCSTCGIASRTSRSARRQAARARPTRRRIARRRRRASRTCPRAARRSARASRGRIEVAFGWDNEFDAHVRRRAGVRHRRLQRHQRRLSCASSTPAATTTASCGPTEGWHWRESQNGHASALLGARAASAWLWRGAVRTRAAAARVAGVRQPRRSERLRALGRRTPSDRSGISPRRVRHAATGDGRGPSAVSVGRRAARRDARRISISPAAIRSPSARVRSARARGASRISSATAGSGRRRSSGRFPASADAGVSGVLGGLLRRPALRHEGRLAGDGARADAAQLPQLVPRTPIRTSTRRSAACAIPAEDDA